MIKTDGLSRRTADEASLASVWHGQNAVKNSPTSCLDRDSTRAHGSSSFHWLSHGIVGGSCHKYNFVATKDKHVFVATNILSRQACFCSDKRRVLSQKNNNKKTHVFVATKLYSRKNKTKTIIVAAPANDRRRLALHAQPLSHGHPWAACHVIGWWLVTVIRVSDWLIVRNSHRCGPRLHHYTQWSISTIRWTVTESCPTGSRQDQAGGPGTFSHLSPDTRECRLLAHANPGHSCRLGSRPRKSNRYDQTFSLTDSWSIRIMTK